MKKFIFLLVFLISLFVFASDYSYALVVSPGTAYLYSYSYAYFDGTARRAVDRKRGSYPSDNPLSTHTNVTIEKGWKGRVLADSSVHISWTDASQGSIDVYQGFHIKLNRSSMNIFLQSDCDYSFAISEPAIFSIDYDTPAEGGLQRWFGDYDMTIYRGRYDKLVEKSFDINDTGTFQILLDSPGSYRIFLRSIISLRWSYGGQYYNNHKIGHFNWRLDEASSPVPEPASAFLFFFGLPFISRQKKRG